MGRLSWLKNPDVRVFIDSRVDIFEYAGVFKDYIELMGFDDPLQVLDEYHIRYVLFPARSPLTYLLERDRNWKVDFAGRISTLIERVGPMPPGPAKHAATNKQRWPGEKNPGER